MLEILQSYDKLHEPLGQTSLEPFQVICSVSRAADATSALLDCNIYYASVKMPSFSVCLPQGALVCRVETVVSLEALLFGAWTAVKEKGKRSHERRVGLKRN